MVLNRPGGVMPRPPPTASIPHTTERRGQGGQALSVLDATPPQRPFVVMNPRSGGGKVARFGLQQRAETLGAEVALLDAEHRRAATRRDALARGADLLGRASAWVAMWTRRRSSTC